MKTKQVKISHAKTELSKRSGPAGKKRILGKFNGKYQLPEDLNFGDEEVRELLENCSITREKCLL